MSDVFDVNRYWFDRGRGYASEQLPREYHRLQERYLLDSLKASGVQFESILELGCGFGRITRLLAEEYPDAKITAVDLSEEQLRNAREYCNDRHNIVFTPYDFYSGAPFPGTPCDLVVAVEVFLHHPETFLSEFVRRLSEAAHIIVNIDWSEEWPWPRPEHVWIHDYPALYRQLGLECVALPLPERVAGLQQKLFFAGHHLPKELVAAEQRPIETLAEPPPAAQWYLQLEAAIEDLRRTVPPEASLILVNDDGWGSAELQLEPRRVRPFLERHGQFWGHPPDDAHAIQELARMRRDGATHIAFAWHCFWWLDHYREFAHHLRQCQCVLANDRIQIFELRN